MYRRHQWPSLELGALLAELLVRDLDSVSKSLRINCQSLDFACVQILANQLENLDQNTCFESRLNWFRRSKLRRSTSLQAFEKTFSNFLTLLLV